MWNGLGLFATPPSNVISDALGTMKTVNALRDQNITNALNKIKLQYAPQMAQQAADIGNADVSIEQNKAKYAPQMSAATLSGLNLLNQGRQLNNAMASESFKYLPQQLQQGIALKAAQIEQIKQNMILAPQKLANQTQKTQWYTSPQYNLPKQVALQHGAAKNAFLANNQAGINDLTLNTLNAARGAQALQNGINSPSAPSGSGIMPMGASINSGSPPTAITPQTPSQSPEQQASINQQQLANQIDANKHSVSPQTYRRAESSAELEKLFQDPEQSRMVKNAAYYTGIQGKARLVHDAIFSPNSQRYNDYLTFHNQLPTQLANVTRFMDGMGVQLQTRNELLGNYTKAFNSTLGTPEQAMQQWDNMRHVVRNTAKASLKLAQPEYPGTLEKVNGIDLDSPITPLSKSGSDELVRMISPSGKIYRVPQSEVDEAMKPGNGYKLAPSKGNK